MRAPVMSNLYACIIVLAVIVSGLGGAYIGYHWEGEKPVPEDVTPAPAVVQADNSVIAERLAPAKPTKPPHQLPKGSKEERRVSLTIQPKQPECPPLKLDLSLVQVDGGRRIVASSPDGTIIKSMDMPLEAAFLRPKPRLWAAGISSDLERERYGAWVERDIGRIRAGVDVIEDRGDIEGRVRLGWTF